MTNDTTGDWVNALTAERAAYQREYLRGGHSTHQQESLMDAHARKCAHIISQAYHNGDYSDMWRALSMCARYGIATPSPTINRIIRHTINMAGWNEQRIDEAAFDCEAFARAVHGDAASTQTPERPAGVWLLLDHLTGNANRGNSVAGINAAAIGKHAVKELTASRSLPELVEHPRRYSDDFSSLAVSAYLAGQHRAHSFLTLAHVARVILENMSKTSKPNALIPTEHSLFTNTCVCEHLTFADSSAATLGRLIIWKDTNGLLLRSITAGAYQLDTCSTDALTVAAERWRSIIDGADVDAAEHREARYAHTAIAATLFAYRGTIATGDLSALIDMFNEQEQAREAGKDAHTLTLSFCDPMRHYGFINSVETLIDYVAQRMSGTERAQ